MNRARLLIVALLALVPAGLLARAEEGKRPLSHETLWLLKQVGAPAASPDGRWVVVPLTEPAYDQKDESADLWIVPGDGKGEPRRLTTAHGKESSPAWSPDGTQIAFSAKREGDEVSQIYLLDVRGGEARRLTRMSLAARAPEWSPDGKWILFLGSVHRGAADDSANKSIAEERKNARSRVRIYDGFPIRRWDRWLDDVQTHLFIVPADGSEAPRDLLAGTQLVESGGYSGAFDEGASDDLQPAWAADSRSIVITATTQLDTSAYADVVFHLYEVQLTGGEPRPLTTGDVSYGKACFSPDGKQICFIATDSKGKYYALSRLASAAWPWTGHIELVTPELDYSVTDYAYSPDGRSLYFAVPQSGHVRVWEAPAVGGEPRVSVDLPEGQGLWASMTIPERAPEPILFANWEAAHRPAETYRVDLATAKQARLTRFNVDTAQSVDWPPLREFWFTNRAGRRIHSFVALPPGFDETKKYPLLVLIHGGHAQMWTDSITRRWNYHLLAEPGYVVLLTDYVGSTGYGEQFTRDILGDPLRGPAEDVNAAADEAIRLFPFIDGTRQAAAGASYGGHLANWLLATTTRYKCLISHAGLASLYSQWATSDSIHHREEMMSGPFWERPQAWLDQSPSTYAKDFRTPMLLSVGEKDFRVPLNNVLEMWSLLQRQRVPSRLLVWSDENHWILNGENSRVFYKEVHAWLDQWLQ
jgi:dipeptidyl aminopeptidase/acylaminoacyl peptidase